MKRPNLANKLLAWLSILCLVVVCLASSVPTVAVPRSSVGVMAASGTVQQPTYLFDKYNGSILADLGIKAYNDYLYQVSQAHDLPEVVVAVLDSGINLTHPVFQGRILSEYGRNYYLNDHKEVVYDDTWDVDNSGHGSHVAGLIVDSTLSNVKILPIKIFQGGKDETISGEMIKDAVEYVAGLKKKENLNIVAMNMSLGTSIMSANHNDYRYNLSSYQSYINTLRNAGILPIVAAGNEGETQLKYIKAGRSSEWYSLPSSCVGTVAVSAYDTRTPARKLANFSNFGVHIRLSAPGVQIVSAWNTDAGSQLHSESGTSMATPFVTLCYAMLMSDITKTTAADLGITWHDSEKSSPFYYLNVQHKALLLHAEDLGETGIDTAYGYGSVNVTDFACPAAQVPVKESYDANEVRNPTVVVLTGGSSQSPLTGAFDNIENVFWVAAGLMVVLIIINAIRFRMQRARYQNEGETTDEQ